MAGDIMSGVSGAGASTEGMGTGGGGGMNAGMGSFYGAMIQAESQGSSTPGGGSISISNPAAAIYTLISDIKKANEEKRKFDLAFAENQRRFGLEYALKEFATRKGLELEAAKQLYEAKFQSGQLQAEMAKTREALLTSAQERSQKEELFDWAVEDRTKQATAEKAFSKGVLRGLSGRA